MELYGEVADIYLDFATYDAGTSGSHTFAEWASAVAADPDVLAWLATLPPVKRQPNLVFAAARWHKVPAPGPYAGLRAALLADGDDGPIRATILARRTQTNEVGRLAALLPAFASLAGERALALVEAGASAGLCLYPDRWGYEWVTGDGPIVLESPVEAGPRLRCLVEGTVPGLAELAQTERPLSVAWRGGIDLNPLDVADEEEMAWLEQLVWPEHEDRRERLRQAIAIARTDPPRLVRGDLLTELPRLVEQAAAYGEVVVFHSAVIAYLEPEGRQQFDRLMRGLVAEGACHWVSNEGKKVLPSVTATGPEIAPETATFVLGIDGRAVAHTHGHGRSMTWLV